jgi:hypothetical protein
MSRRAMAYETAKAMPLIKTIAVGRYLSETAITA